MTRFALLALPLLVAACGGSTLRPPPEPETAEVAACRAESRNDPRFAAIGASVLPGNAGNARRVAEDRARLEAELVSACLRARGGQPRGGGVEAVRR